MNWKCFFGLHEWRRWTRPFPNRVHDTSIQTRECEVCGKVQKRTVRWAQYMDCHLNNKMLEGAKALESLAECEEVES